MIFFFFLIDKEQNILIKKGYVGRIQERPLGPNRKG